MYFAASAAGCAASFNDNVQDEVFIYNDNVREKKFIDEKTEKSKKLTLNPIKKKKTMTLSEDRFKHQKSEFCKASVNKSIYGKTRLWALKKLKLLVDRRERMEMHNK